MHIRVYVSTRLGLLLKGFIAQTFHTYFNYFKIYYDLLFISRRTVMELNAAFTQNFCKLFHMPFYFRPRPGNCFNCK